MAESKPRIFQSGKDILLTLGLLLVVAAIFVAPTGMCSFHPGAPEHGPVQDVDAASFLKMEAHQSKFPLRLPATPEGWVPNSARRTSVTDRPAPSVGWVTKGEGYLQLIQTDVPLDKLKNFPDDPNRKPGERKQVSGTTFETFHGDRDLWIADLGTSRALIKGSASEGEFQQLAEALVQAPRA